MTKEIAILIIQALLKYGPAAARSIRDILSKDQPTPEDWERVFASVDKSYDDYTK